MLVFLRLIYIILLTFHKDRTVKIGVISDTHMKRCDDRLRRIADDYFRDVDMILHAGDLVDLDVLRAFDGTEVRAVRGNMDGEEAKAELPEQVVLDLESQPEQPSELAIRLANGLIRVRYQRAQAGTGFHQGRGFTGYHRPVIANL